MADMQTLKMVVTLILLYLFQDPQTACNNRSIKICKLCLGNNFGKCKQTAVDQCEKFL